MSEPTEREWLEGIGERFEREHEENRPRPVFVDSVDVDAAWEVYYRLADRRHKPGLTRDELAEVIAAGLVGVVEAVPFNESRYNGKVGGVEVCKWRSPWVEVEEHQDAERWTC